MTHDFTGKSIKCETWEQMQHLAKLAEEQGYRECTTYEFKQTDFNSGEPFFAVDSFKEYSTYTTCKSGNIQTTYTDFINTLPTEVVEVTGCGDCPFSTTLPLDTDWCSHPNHENKGYTLFQTCPLKKASLTIKLKQNEPTGN